MLWWKQNSENNTFATYTVNKIYACVHYYNTIAGQWFSLVFNLQVTLDLRKFGLRVFK